MNVSRRNLIKAGAVTAVAATSAVRTTAAGHPVLFVWDSRLPESAAMAATFSCAKLDVAQEDRNFWSTLRAGLPQGRVVGLTRWSDLVAVRGELEAQGKRLKSERQRDSHAPFYWEMA